MEKNKLYIAECCATCIKGKKEDSNIKCQKVDGVLMYFWGLCSEYDRDKTIKYPLPREYTIGGRDSKGNIIWRRNELT